MKEFGIDISKWQKNYPYKKADAEGVKFVIIRAGYATTKDPEFETHYKNAQKLGWYIGTYWYSYATSVAEAEAEAKAFIKTIKNKKFDYPVYLDIEDASIRKLKKETINNIVRKFCNTVQDAGYYCGVYSNKDWYDNVLSGKELNKDFDWWIAAWNSSEPKGVDFGVWQFGGSTNKIRSPKIGGVTTDQNYSYKDYPTIIKEKGLNGYTNENEIKPDIPFAELTDEELAAKVWAGEFGNGEEREKLLGSRYDAVQALVNNGVGKSDTLKIGDKVKIISNGNSSSDGTGSIAYGLGYERYITNIYSGKPFPYQVGNKNKTDSANTTGFYSKSALKRI